MTNKNFDNCAFCGLTEDENSTEDVLFDCEPNGVLDDEIFAICAECAEAKGFVRCEDCGCYIPKDMAVEEDGAIFCRDCSECVQCEDCGCFIPESRAIQTEDGFICDECYEDGDYFTCEDCGIAFTMCSANTVNPHTYGEGIVCDDCLDNYYQCDDCGEYFSEGYTRSDYSTVVCDRCYDWNDWITCDDCGSLIRGGEANWSSQDDCYYCDSCYEEHEPHLLNEYSFKPTPEFKFRSSELREFDRKGIDPRNAVHQFGIELEVDNGDDADDLCESLEGLDQPIYMKHDGSLNHNGVEIVTHPCSLAFHQYEMRWAEIMRVCDSHDYKSHDTTTCGLHIHVSRSSMGTTEEDRQRTAGNLVILTSAIWDELVKFSRRMEHKLDQWAQRPMLDHQSFDSDEELIEIALKHQYRGGIPYRYSACNLLNTHTVEFRLFRGTLKRRTLIAAIQLVSNMTDYAMTHTPSECISATWSDIMAVAQFKELTAYCESRGL